jgi:hypothetical protein
MALIREAPPQVPTIGGRVAAPRVRRARVSRRRTVPRAPECLIFNTTATADSHPYLLPVAELADPGDPPASCF